ncbi:DUF5615 family PIN-like protein [Nitratifractor sp.]
MKIIIDECLPKRCTGCFESHEVYTVPQIGLSGWKDGELLRELARRGIDCFVTIDGNMEYQQHLERQPYMTIVLRAHSNRFRDLLPMREEMNEVLENVTPGRVVHLPF